MNARRALLPIALLAGLAPQIAGARRGPVIDSASGVPLAHVPSGTYRALYGARPEAVPVAAFSLMTRPVTNGEFLAFVIANPTYRRDRIARVFADSQYLSHWASATALGSAARDAQPVTRVSWFAAKAFCEARGLRLPSEAEWELAAAASETRANDAADARVRERLLRWYSTPNDQLPDVPHAPANVFGIHDLHGVIWEWVLDFNASSAIADAKGTRFCGSSGTSNGDTTDYPAFMRAALRSSLEASYTLANLGFRCAADARGGRP
jgi:formylglycine-generating enzyme required for sulfatase activity